MSAHPITPIPLVLISVDDSKNSRQVSGLDKESIKSLAQSIKTTGQLVPIIIRETPHGSHTYDLVAGFRRYKAVTQLKVPTIDATVLPPVEDPDERELQDFTFNITENHHRVNLSSGEMAQFVQRTKHIRDRIGMSAFAAHMGISVGHVSVLQNLSDKLHDSIKKDWYQRHAYLSIPVLKRFAKMDQDHAATAWAIWKRDPKGRPVFTIGDATRKKKVKRYKPRTKEQWEKVFEKLETCPIGKEARSTCKLLVRYALGDRSPPFLAKKYDQSPSHQARKKNNDKFNEDSRTELKRRASD